MLFCGKIRRNWLPKLHRLESVTALLSTPEGVTVTVTSVLCDKGPLVPVMFTLYVPCVVELREQDTLAVAFAVRLALGGQPTLRPVAGVTVVVRVTVPTKLLRLVRVTGMEEGLPEAKLTEPGADIWKSPT